MSSKDQAGLEEALRRKREARENAMMAGYGQNDCPVSVRTTSWETVSVTIGNVTGKIVESASGRK